VAIDELIDGIETLGAQGPVVALRQIAHRLAGLAGTIGMPEVSQAAIALDRMLAEETADPARLRRACAELLVGFSVDLAAVPPSWVVAEGAARGAHVLLVERDPRVAAGLQADLCGAGYRVSHAMSGDRAMAIVQTDVPDLVLLDLETPGQPDGYGVCRRLKSDPALLAIPVVILSNAAASVDRVAGFALGADEYLAKPIETIELLHRVRWMLSRPATERQIVASGGGELLTADAFLAAARELLRQVPGALALVRVTPAQVTDVSALLADDLRRKDLVGRYSETQIAVLMPGASAGVALKRLSTVLERARAAGLDGLVAGVTVSGHRQQRLIEPLLAQAEAAQASAHVPGELVSVHGVIGRTSTATILVVDDDPDVVHMVDSRLKASGLATALAFDGEEALRQIDTRAPALVVLGLTLPKLSGFDLLARIRELPEPRPRVVAVSGHSDEENLTRAFSLGADDYLTKPFNPHELLVRINRLIR
jgi:DNA-binding response OmpR family regulator